MLFHAILLNFAILSQVILKIVCVIPCDNLYSSDTGVLTINNDFSGRYKLQVVVWLDAEKTSEVLNVTPTTKLDDLDTANHVEYLLEYAHNSISLKVINVTLNDKSLCSSTLEKRNGQIVIAENILIVPTAQLNSQGCGKKAEVNPFFLDAPKPSETPWLVAFYACSDAIYKYACAGNLITDRHIITVAKCFSGGIPNENYAVVMATNSLINWVKRGVIRGVKRATIHEDFRPPAEADVALITIDKPIKFTANVRPICILTNQLNPEETGLFSGWGGTEPGKELLHVRHLPVSSIKEEDCRRLDPVYYHISSNRSFCVGESKGSPASPCTGDHGGGFAVEAFGKWTLRGVASIILRQCSRKLYSVFVNVLKFNDWIVKQIEVS